VVGMREGSVVFLATSLLGAPSALRFSAAKCRMEVRSSASIVVADVSWYDCRLSCLFCSENLVVIPGQRLFVQLKDPEPGGDHESRSER
jgi:hypothetical protein